MTRRRRLRERRPGLVHELLPPEGVPIRFEVAGLGSRLGAQVTDLLLSLAAVIALLVLLVLSNAGTATVAVGALLFFAVRTPYYVVSELLWNGRTLGKRMNGLRVVAADGRGLTAHAVVVRNLMKEVEVFVPGTWLLLGGSDLWTSMTVLGWILVLVAVPRFNRRRQRIGDIVAGTMVIRQPQAVLLPDLTASARAPAAGRFVFDTGQLDHYGRYELQTLERVLQSASGGDPAMSARRRADMEAVARTIRARIGYREPVSDAEAAAFLHGFYVAQREYLERRRLFGDSREDKFHREDTAGAAQPPRLR